MNRSLLVLLLWVGAGLSLAAQARGLEGPYDPVNPFARILRGEAPVSKVYEDADVLAFLPITMQARGHVLDDRAELDAVAAQLAAALKR